MSTIALTDRLYARRRLLGALALLITAALLGLVSGRLAMSHYGKDAIFALIGLPVVIYLWPRPLVSLIALVALLGVISYGQIPRVSLPGHPPLNLTDVLLVLLVGGTIWRRRWRTWPTDVRRFGVALAILLAIGAFPTVMLLTQGHDPAREGILGYKTLLYIAVGVTVGVELARGLWRPLLNASIVLATIIAVLSLLAGASGSVASFVNHFNATSVTTGTTVTGGASRIRLPGLFFVYAMTIPTLTMALVVKDRWRLARLLALIPMIAAIAISFNRNMYFGAVIGLLVAVVVGGPRLRHRIGIALLALAATIAIVVQSAVLPAATSQVAQRARSALSTSVLSSSSIEDRSDEFAHALQTIRAHPLLGVGWFQPYGSYSLSQSGEIPRLGVEDLYLHLATDLGIPVLAAFALLVVVLLSGGVKRAREATDPVARALVGAGVGTIVALLISCLVGAYLQDPGTTMMFGLACGGLLAAGVRARRVGTLPARPVRPLAAAR